MFTQICAVAIYLLFCSWCEIKLWKRANLVCHSNTVTYQCEEKEWQAL